MKRIFSLLSIPACTSLLVFLGFLLAQSQTVTNTGLDVILDTNIDNSLRTSWKVDENLRTNGLAPYTNVQAVLTYKQFLAAQFGTVGGVVDGTIAQAEEVLLFQQIRSLRNSDPNTYRKIFRIAYGLSN